MIKSYEIDTGPKQSCRSYIADVAEQYLDKTRTILTLPGEVGLCVKTFKERFKKANIVAIESDTSVCESVRENLGIPCFNVTLKQYLLRQNIPADHIDVAFFDYYSFFQKSILEDLKLFTSNENIFHNGKETILAITLMKSIRRDKDVALSYLREGNFNGDILQIENNIEQLDEFFANYLTIDCGVNVKRLKSLEYRANENSSMMYFFCFKIYKS